MALYLRLHFLQMSPLQVSGNQRVNTKKKVRRTEWQSLFKLYVNMQQNTIFELAYLVVYTSWFC